LPNRERFPDLRFRLDADNPAWRVTMATRRKVFDDEEAEREREREKNREREERADGKI